MRPIIASSVLFVLLATGCGGDDDDTVRADDPEPTGTADVTGDYVSTSVDGHELVDGTDISLNLTEDEVSGTAGCNSFGGPYHLEDFDGTTGVLVIDADGMSMTEMACDEPRMAQDTWFTGLLMARPTVTVTSDSELSISDGTATVDFLDREVADPDRPLVGTEWTVDTILTGDAASSIPTEGTVVTFVFDDDQVIASASDCTSVEVPYGESEGTLAFGDYGVDDIGCPAPWNETRALFDAGIATYTIDHGRLSLTAPDGNGLSLVAE